MSKYKAKNEKIKRRYFKWSRDAEGYAPATIESIEKALWDYEAFSSDDDYANFNDKTAQNFKRWLSEKRLQSGEIISLSTQYDRLRHLKKFFTWLSGQVGYKSKIDPYDSNYLRLDKKLAKIATAPKVEDYPTLEYVKKLCDSIEVKGEIDLRDRALIAFTLLSGMRDKAIITLPLGCFNPDTYEVGQYPAKGVQTKFSKTIISVLFQFDTVLLGYVLEWVKHLKEVKVFGIANPLFPSTKVEQMSVTEYIFEAKGVEPTFWRSTSTMCKIFKDRAENAGLPYYSPHKFRHSATRLATDSCRSAEQIKAVSQNLGHEHVGTTLLTYGRLGHYRVNEVVSGLSFQKTAKEKNLEEAIKLLNMART